MSGMIMFYKVESDSRDAQVIKDTFRRGDISMYSLRKRFFTGSVDRKRFLAS